MFSLNQKAYFLLTIIILFIIFFICGILHLLIKHFLKPISSESEETATATSFQGQLQQLFHLHDEGVDQSFIETLPIFLYKSIIGPKDPFDCVVCLCEFELDDKLRLLPNCSHAFHVECIDTWLLSHSTCPLCRQSLLHECSPERSSYSSSIVEDDSANSRHEVGAKDELSLKERTQCMELPLLRAQPYPNACKETVLVARTCDLRNKQDDELNLQYVKLGKFRNVDVGEEGTSRGNSELKERCFSMGAIEYVMNERTVLQVAIKTLKKQSKKISDGGSARIGEKCNKESFSASKVWTGMGLRREKAVYDDCSRRAISFRLPKQVSDLGLDLEAGR